MFGWLGGDQAEPHVEVAGERLPLAIRRHPRARRLTMRLAADGKALAITMPQWGRTADALDFARSRRAWIESQLARRCQTISIAPGTALPYRGHAHPIAWRADAPRKPRLIEGRVECGGPAEGLEPRLRRWLESEALRLLAADLAFYCDRAGEAEPQLRLSRARRRWGSCSAETREQRCIRINWRLVLAPDQVRRSVVAHEVAHLAHFDHSPAFHAHLARLFEGDLTSADRWLKAEGRSLYALFG